MKKTDRTKNYLVYIFAAATAAVLLLSSFITSSIELLLKTLGIVTEQTMSDSWLLVGLISGVACAIIGGLLSLITNRLILRHVNTMLDGMNKLANGKYETRVYFGKAKSLRLAADSFNRLAEQLENTEILRSDFVNNFSHEFKTPIVSIKGLISLMKSGRVSKEKQQEYLRIIEEEVDRLTVMTTNVLNLSKIENQSIIAEKCEYNLSEQLRTSILLEERRWSEKELSLSLDFDEYNIIASEDLMKQVWLNLIDNAIKFSPRGGELRVSIEDHSKSISVTVSNNGSPISDEEKSKIWGKFYQTDRGRSKSGNGIGLSIVKSIVELHNGVVDVVSDNGVNSFIVTLPKISG